MLKILISQRTTETGLTSDCLDGLKDSVMPSFNINGVNKGHEPIIYIFFFLWRCGPTRARASSCLRFLYHAQLRITVGRTSLDE